MVAPEVASLIVTVCDVEYVPATGEKVGFGSTGAIINDAVAVGLFEYPLATAIADIVSFELTVIAPL